MNPQSEAAAAEAKPVRVQLSRAKRFKLPPNTVKVDRSTRWGNPFKLLGVIVRRRRYRPYGVSEITMAVRAQADIVRQLAWPVEQFRKMLAEHGRWTEPAAKRFACLQTTVDDVKRELVGRNLACWCRPGNPCHADVLLAIANGWPCPPLIEEPKPSPALEAGIEAMKAHTAKYKRARTAND